MACCGGKKRKLRSQTTVKKSAKKSGVKVQRVKDRRVSQTIERQHVSPHAKCPECGYPTMLVNIGGRERQQCSNANCRQILK